MAVLPNIDRRDLWAKFMSNVSSRNESFGLMRKNDVRGVVDTMEQKLDVFIDGLDTPPTSPIAVLSMRQRLQLMMDNIERRLRKL